ncbi:MAG: prolyl oligopeptidase family serine peptidase [Candidatus Heimdallarchaeota archaeon]|nr:prolyl oligopeptidase family serine peptidase [Candidatus Heimdallarchaeota archaeon]
MNKKNLMIEVYLLSMSSTNEKSNEKKQISKKDLFKLKQIGEPTFRPETNELYYTLSQANQEDNDYRKTIWRYREEPKQFTQGLPSDSMIKWSPDGKLLAFLSVRGVLSQGKGTDSSEPPKPQIYLIPYDGGEAQQLTNIPTGVAFFDWSKDGKKILFISRMNKEELEAPPPKAKKDWPAVEVKLKKLMEKEREQKKKEPKVIERLIYRAGTSYRDDRNGQIHVLDLETKKVERWTNSLEDDYQQAFLTLDNKYAITARQKPGEGDETRNYEIIRINIDGEIELIAEHYAWGVDLNPSPNREFVATTLADKEKGTLGIAKLVVYDLEDGSRKLLAEELDYPKLILNWSEDGKYLYFNSPQKGTCGIWRVDVTQDTVEELVSGDRVIIGFDVSKDQEWLGYQVHHVSDPSRLYRYHIPTKKEELLHAPNKEFLEKRKLGKTETIWYDGFNNDFKIQGWILTPPDFDPDKKYPLALNMHGGPHVMWSNHQSIPLFHEFNLLASEGYVVFYCNPRGSEGYGTEFRAAIEKSWGEKDSKDILKGVDLVVERGYIDEERMALTGGSYAGFLTAWIVGHDDRFAAAVSQRGVYALKTFWGTSDARILIDDEFGATPLEDPDLLWKYSPAAYAKNITTPIIILHSELDYRAPIPDAELLYAAIKRSHPDLDVQFVRYPEEGHELSRSGQPKRRLDRLQRIIDWFNKYCQPTNYQEQKEQEKEIEEIIENNFKQMREKIKGIKKK